MFENREAHSPVADPLGDLVTTADRQAYMDFALSLADTARSISLTAWRSSPIVEVKPDRSLVTSTDREIEVKLRELIAKRFPSHAVLGEEFGLSGAGPFRWILDPIDGTEEFVHRMETFGSIIALWHGDHPIVGVIDVPCIGTRAWATRGLGTFRDGVRVMPTAQTASAVRCSVAPRSAFERTGDGEHFTAITKLYPNVRTTFSCYSHLLVACGAMDVGVEWAVREWDLAATGILCSEAGLAYAPIAHPALDAKSARCSAIFGKHQLVSELCKTLIPAQNGETQPDSTALSHEKM